MRFHLLLFVTYIYYLNIHGGQTVVYFYYFKSLKSVLLNPFDKNKEIGNMDSEQNITILSANTLSKEDYDIISEKAFTEIDNSVNLWIQEKRYYPRLFISALAFFIMYFFLSFAIRDPIPLLDEMIGSVVFTIITWIFFTKRDSKSSIANKKKLEIKRNVNDLKSKEIGLLQKIEAYLYELKDKDNLDIADALTLVEGSIDELVLDQDDEIYLADFLTLLKKKLFSMAKLKSLYTKVIKVRETKEKDEALSSRLIEFGRDDKFSLLLITLLIVLEKK